MNDFTLWKRKVLDAIQDLADLGYQKRAWLGGGEEVASFVETVAALLDDSFFDQFLDEAPRSQTQLDDDSWAAMDQLRKLIYAYEEAETDDAILKDPKWHEVVKQAREVMSLVGSIR
ncbi:hypothetical protein [Hymenobacter arizonensis]|uniref:Self-protective colicin-like immunity n=1 Tax=Hymenobacter arizonensis TaxID=1227077 RepID=A0A1I6BR78_HYMAR|nr:hypothetical protein [Hymenobacter arizonensis]SFQ83429.1 hypothetical protein SAMN04515668_4964 [Hymenobacter arizonensis]